MNYIKKFTNQEIKSLKKEYEKKGYIIIRNLISNQVVKKLNENIDKLPPISKIPFSDNVPWGYGNLRQDKNILNLMPIKELENNIRYFLRNGEKICNHVLVVDKVPFLGPDVEWHQEFFNIDTFAPGYSSEKDLDCFIQIFTALDQHQSKNGPLLVFEGSHKEGLLAYEDIINANLSHKRRLNYKGLINISNKYEMKEVLLMPGDCIFFNHLLVHGSPTNCSKFRRRAILHQFRINKSEKNQKIYDKEVKNRRDFLINNLKNKVDQLNDKDPYKDMK
tara:strand:+ start:2219 stop:3049 length:831 start_codon:yes stop_codon:yes gene_type:complete